MIHPPDENEIPVVAIVQARPGHADVVAQLLSAVVAPSRAEAGCLGYRLHRDRADGDRFVFIERWADRAALDAHERTAHFAYLGAALADHVLPGIAVMKLDEIG